MLEIGNWRDESEPVSTFGAVVWGFGSDSGGFSGFFRSGSGFCLTADGSFLLTKQLLAYGDRPDIIQMATAYTAGIVLDHPFIDGNKRTGFVVGVLFLELNGYRFVASEEDAAQAVLSLAAGTLEEDPFATWMRANVGKQ